MKKILFIILLYLFISVASVAQNVTHLTVNPSLTVEEITNIYSSVNKDQKEQAEQIIAIFPSMWDAMSNDEQLIFIDLANKIFKAKMRPIPQLADFIKTYKLVIESNQSKKSEQNFAKSIEYIVKNHSNQFIMLMKAYYTVLNENILNRYSGLHWYTANVDHFYFEFDSIPKIVYPKLDLVASNGKDSLQIKNTSGYFSPTTMVFIGGKGMVDWQKAGVSEKVYATFDSYKVLLRSVHIEIEQALYHNPEYFTAPQLGKLEDRVMSTEVAEEKVTYPRFTSYDKNIKVNNICSEVDYCGGIHMRGNTFMGQGEAANLAELRFKRENKVVMIAKSASFVLKPKQLSSKTCRTILYVDKDSTGRETDSIFHSAIELQYTPQSRELWLFRGKEGPMRMPFFDSYHQVDIFADALHWKMNEENIEFGPIPGPMGNVNALIESVSYFSADRLYQFMGMNQVNPLYTLYEFYRTTGVREATVDEIAAYFKYSRSDIQSLIFQLVEYGFVDYDINDHTVKYLPRLGNYLLNDLKKKDYDILQFRSTVGAGHTNATFSLINNDLDIKGIDLIIVSDSQIVNVLPKEKKITMKQNRDFVFHGKVEVGLFDFWVTNSKFNYESFTMDFAVVDSLMFFVEDKSKGQNAMGEYPLEKVRSYLSDISGTLYIDQANNKSSTLSIPGYPYFDSKSKGRVYYNHDFVYNGAYDKERFYFQTTTFTIKNMDDFDTDSLLFDGFLYSGGIFPDIERPLRVRPDFSLGFIYNTNGEMPAYQGRGSFDGKIDLSNQGLRCTGKLDYLQSHAEGKHMLFFLDSMNAIFDNYRIDAQLAETEFPPVQCANTKAHWLPYEDKMFVNNTKPKFTMYTGTQLDGQLVVSSSGVRGSGDFIYDIATMHSQDYEFLHHEMKASSLDIDLYDSTSNDYYIKATDHKAYLNFEKQKGNFIANGNAQPIFFPINMFKTYAKEFDWLVAEKQLQFTYEDKYASVDIPNTEIKDLYTMRSEGNELISTNPEQKQLQFTTTRANYDFSKYEITAYGVRFVEIADAAVFPKEGIVKIHRKANIAPLKDSKILANTDNQYHEVYKANVLLEAKDAYHADGYYNYIDAKEKRQEIYLDSLWINKDKQTRGYGKIGYEANFTLNPHFGYSGSVTLKAEDKFLTMRGAVSLLYSCDTNQYAPIRFNGAVNPDSVLIPITAKTRDTNDMPVVAAIASNAEGKIYPAIGRAKDRINNPEYISVYGYLTYNEEIESYVVASLEKLDNLDLPGNAVYLDKKNCIARGEGRLDLGTNFGRMEFVPMGQIVNYIEKDSAKIEVSASLNFYFNEQCMNLLSEYIEASQNLEPVDVIECKSYQTALLEMLGEKEYARQSADLKQYYHFRRLPKALQLTFMFADVNMAWNVATKSFVSQDKELGITICGKKEVNKQVPGILEIQKKSTNKSSNNKTTLHLYLEFDDQWFYFYYAGTTMQAVSSVKEFNQWIKDTPQKKKELQSDKAKNLGNYRYTLASLSLKKKFLNRHQEAEEDETQP